MERMVGRWTYAFFSSLANFLLLCPVDPELLVSILLSVDIVDIPILEFESS